MSALAWLTDWLRSDLVETQSLQRLIHKNVPLTDWLRSDLVETTEDHKGRDRLLLLAYRLASIGLVGNVVTINVFPNSPALTDWLRSD